MELWKTIVDELGAEVIGETRVELEKASCSSRECNLGNFFADAMVHAFTKLTSFSSEAWTTVAIGLINTGALRVPLYRGNLTYSHLVTMSPFENRLTAFDLPGSQLAKALEFGVYEIDLAEGVTSSSIFLQVSGLRVVYDLSAPRGQRVQQLLVRCQNCSVPVYEEFDSQRVYRLITTDFIVGGGGGFSMFAEFATDLQKEMTDIEAIIDYVRDTQPIMAGIERRITIV